MESALHQSTDRCNQDEMNTILIIVQWSVILGFGLLCYIQERHKPREKSVAGIIARNNQTTKKKKKRV
jgi:hypothetical protein